MILPSVEEISYDKGILSVIYWDPVEGKLIKKNVKTDSFILRESTGFYDKPGGRKIRQLKNVVR